MASSRRRPWLLPAVAIGAVLVTAAAVASICVLRVGGGHQQHEEASAAGAEVEAEAGSSPGLIPDASQPGELGARPTAESAADGGADTATATDAPSLRPAAPPIPATALPTQRSPPPSIPPTMPAADSTEEEEEEPYVPFVFTGKLTLHADLGIRVAAGLTVRVVAQSDRTVEFTSTNATSSNSGKKCRFHVRPDGAATFDASGTGTTDNKDNNDNLSDSDYDEGDWYYCSNSEVKEYQNSADNRCNDQGNGGMLNGKCRAGVYCLLFDRDGRVKNYEHRLGGDKRCGSNDGIGPDLPSTSTNCQGGVTPWSTYVSCEETGSGYCWQVDPTGRRSPQRIDALGVTKPGEDVGGWEAMAVDRSDPDCPVFFFTEDRIDGKVRRLRPDCERRRQPPGWDMLHGEGIKVDYLEFVGGCGGGNEGGNEGDGSGTTTSAGAFRWTDSAEDGERSAEECYSFAEGIAFANKRLYFVTKDLDTLFSLDHEELDSTSSSTGGDSNGANGGAAGGRWEADRTHTNKQLEGEGNFDLWPDQITTEGDFMFHTTDGSATPGVYLHNLISDKYYTLWQSVEVGKGEEESVGHAMSPDGRFILGALQKDGRLFLLARDDGAPFRGLEFALRRG